MKAAAIVFSVMGLLVSASCSNELAAPISKLSVAFDDGAPATSIDGATLLLLESNEALYFSSKLATFLTMVERQNVFRRVIGEEVVLEGAFLARRVRDGQAEEIGGIAASSSAHAGGVAISYIRTYAGEDRVVDFFAREREMRAVSITGVGGTISCFVTDWLSSKRSVFSQADYRQERCRLVQGRAFAVGP